MRAVRAHDEVEDARLPVQEAHGDAVVGLVEGGHGVVEQVLGVIADVPVERRAQVPPAEHEPGLPGDEGGHSGDHRSPASPVVEADPFGRGDAQSPELVQEAHAAQGPDSGPLDLEAVTAVPHRRCPFHDGRTHAVSAQPVRQRGSGDASAGDEDAYWGHVGLLRTSSVV